MWSRTPRSRWAPSSRPSRPTSLHTSAVRHAIGVGSGTDALHLALRACGVGAGDEVITAVNTFAATAEAIIMAGAKPVFVDVTEDTLLMDLDDVETAVTKNTRAIIPVHLYGQPVDMDRLMGFARPRGIKVIEDACQSHGARCGKFRTGGIGDAGCFSFYPSKNLGALGDGGIVTTDDDQIAERVRLLRNHGEEGSSRLHVESGYCTRLHTLQAAFLNEKLPYLDEWNALRMRAAALYDDMLAPSDVVVPCAPRWCDARLPPLRDQGLGQRPGPSGACRARNPDRHTLRGPAPPRACVRRPWLRGRRFPCRRARGLLHPLAPDVSLHRVRRGGARL